MGAAVPRGLSESRTRSVAVTALAPRNDRPRRHARVAGLLTSICGGAILLALISPLLGERLDWLVRVAAPEVLNGPRGALLIWGVALLLLGRGLTGQRRTAMAITAVYASCVGIGHALLRNGAGRSLALAAVAVTLIVERDVFVCRLPKDRLAVVGRCAIIVGCFATLAGFDLWLHRSGIEPALTWRTGGHEFFARFFGFTGPLTIHGRTQSWLPVGTTLVGFTVILVVLTRLLRAGPAAAEDPLAREAVRHLIREKSTDTLDPFALRVDKRYVFGRDGQAALAYRSILGVGLVGGDPVGEPESFGHAIDHFLDDCAERGWRPAATGVREDVVPLFRERGLRAMYIGDEAIIDVDRFSLAGGRMRNVRHAVNRSKNFEVSTRHVRQGDLDADTKRALIGVAERWRAHAPEMGFSMALDTLLSDRDPESVIAIADQHGEPIGFQRYVPCKGGRALSLDAMRRDRHSPNGINERMIHDTVRWAADHGFAEVSLNFAAFRRVIEPVAPGQRRPSSVAIVIAFDRILPFVKIISLARFNAKFAPRWEPRYLVYRSRFDLPAVGLAALSAEGFLPFDRGRVGQLALST